MLLATFVVEGHWWKTFEKFDRKTYLYVSPSTAPAPAASTEKKGCCGPAVFSTVSENIVSLAFIVSFTFWRRPVALLSGRYSPEEGCPIPGSSWFSVEAEGKVRYGMSPPGLSQHEPGFPWRRHYQDYETLAKTSPVMCHLQLGLGILLGLAPLPLQPRASRRWLVPASPSAEGHRMGQPTRHWFPCFQTDSKFTSPRLVFLRTKGNTSCHFSFKNCRIPFCLIPASVHGYICMCIYADIHIYEYILRWKSWESCKIMLHSNTLARKVPREAARGLWGMMLHSGRTWLEQMKFIILFFGSQFHTQIHTKEKEKKFFWWLCSRQQGDLPLPPSCMATELT